MRIVLAFGLLALLVVSGCSNASKEFPGYSVTRSGIHYRLIALGDGFTKASPADYVTVSIAYRTINDSLFFHGVRRFQLTVPQFTGSVDECFAMLAQGDSAAFYINADDFFAKTLETNLPRFIVPESYIRVDIRLLDLQSERQYQQEKEAFLHWIEDFGNYERVLLKQYLEEEELDFAPTTSGIYYIPMETGSGVRVQVGDTVIVHYEGRFFNSKVFDSTRKRNEPFHFVYGQKWQVVEGLEEAIGMMYPGERSLFIIPSHLAFGQGGSTTGIVPPFTSVVFDVEIIEVKTRRDE
jgi:FKBP-type peptidyl-prolyl cis-trans isomerase FkpA